MRKQIFVDQVVLDHVKDNVQRQCIGVAQVLINELQSRFPSHEIMDALDMLYPQYWLQAGVDVYFPHYLAVFKAHYVESKTLKPKVKGANPVVILSLLSAHLLDSQQSLFKLSMKSNAANAMRELVDQNPLTCIWRTISTSKVLSSSFPEYLKLAKVGLVQVIGSVEDERCFSALNFIKNKNCHCLTKNLELSMRIFAQKFWTLEDFPFQEAFYKLERC